MQKKTSAILAVLIVTNLIFILATIGQTLVVKNKNAEIKTLASKNQSLNQKVIKYNSNNKTETLVNGEKAKKNVVDFINAQFNYTNENYKSRFEDIKKYVTTDVYSALNGAGDVTTPKTKIQSKVDNLNVYLATNNNQTITALINISTIYSVEGVGGSPINQIYELELKEQEKDKWIITKYTLMGNFQPYSTNK